MPALPVEFYQLMLAATWHADGLWGEATFDLYAGGLPEDWGFLVAAGLQPLLDRLSALRFSDDQVAALAKHPTFQSAKPAFFDYLTRFRFEADVHAVPEGTPVFPGEPILRVTAPLLTCGLIETLAIQMVSASSVVATQAARLVSAAGGAPVYDFGSRRMPHPDAALLAARAAYIGGVHGTTNAAAVLEYGLPAIGTMSDTFLAAYGDKQLAFDAFRLHFPAVSHLALSDQDPVRGVAELRRFRGEVASVRLDHPDLNAASRAVRAELDRNGYKSTQILGSGHLDEHRIAGLVAAGAPVDQFAVGRAFARGAAESVRMAFRIAERQAPQGTVPVRGEGAARWPGKKQIIRTASGDQLVRHAEAWALERAGGVGLLRPAAVAAQSLSAVRAHCNATIAALPLGVRRLTKPDAWPVVPGPGVA